MMLINRIIIENMVYILIPLISFPFWLKKSMELLIIKHYKENILI